MTSVTPDRALGTFLKYVSLAFAAYYLLAYIAAAALRMPYPFEFEWMEGGTLAHIERILDGQKIYVAPSADFVPFIYTPLYYYVSAAAAKIMGPGFLAPRAVSFIASLACFGLIFQWVRRETKEAALGFLAAGLFAATFKIAGSWFDLARVDSLFLMFTLAGLYFTRFHASSTAGVFLSGLFMVLAFQTKQAVLPLCFALAAYYLLCGLRPFFIYVLTTGLLLGLSIFLLDQWHEGWYRFTVFHLIQKVPLLKERFFSFWKDDLFRPLPVASAASLVFVGNWKLFRSWLDHLFYVCSAAGIFCFCLLSRMNLGGFNNVLMPVYAIMSILCLLGLHRLNTGGSGLSRIRNLVLVAYIAQLILLRYDPMSSLPTQKDLAGGQKISDLLSDTPGEALIPYHGYLTRQAGKKSQAHPAAMMPLERAAPDFLQPIVDEIAGSIRSQKFEYIILDPDTFHLRWYLPDVYQYYEKKGELFQRDGTFWTKTGIITRPVDLYVRRRKYVG